jgi:hypothetical protein
MEEPLRIQAVLPQRKRLKVNQKEKKELRMATKGSRVIP